MASVRKRSGAWYARWVDANGVKHEQRAGTDKRAAEQLAAALETEAAQVKAGIIDPKALGYRDHEAKALDHHLAEWRRGMLARGMTVRHVNQYQTRAARVVALSRGVHLNDIDPPGRKPEVHARAARSLADAIKAARLSDLTGERIQAAPARLREAGKAHQTVNHHRAAIRAFCRWAADTGRLRDNPARGVTSFNVAEDRRHRRRALTPEEARRLIRPPNAVRRSGA